MVYFAMQRGQALGGSPGAGASPSASAPVGPPIPDRTVQATVTEATGSAADLRDTRCNFIVSAERSQRWASGIQCRAQVVCGGRLLFGGPEAGYFECTVTEQPRGVHGEDAGTTSANRDAALLLDSASSTLRVWDDATGPLGEYVVNARIDTVL